MKQKQKPSTTKMGKQRPYISTLNLFQPTEFQNLDHGKCFRRVLEALVAVAIIYPLADAIFFLYSHPPGD